MFSFSLGFAKRILFCEQRRVEDEGSPKSADSLACDGAFKLGFFLFPSRACLLEEGFKQSSVISGTNTFCLFLNKRFQPAVLEFSNVSANPGLKFQKASTWDAFSDQLCQSGAVNGNLL